MIGTEEYEQASVTGEQKLIAAVIKTAIEDYKKQGHLGTWAGTGKWWLFDEDSYRKFSFLWCCEALDLNPEYMREQIIARNPDMDDRKYQTILWGRSKI